MQEQSPSWSSPPSPPFCPANFVSARPSSHFRRSRTETNLITNPLLGSHEADMLSRSYLDSLLERLPRRRVAVGVRALFAKRDFLVMQARARKNRPSHHTLSYSLLFAGFVKSNVPTDAAWLPLVWLSHTWCLTRLTCDTGTACRCAGDLCAAGVAGTLRLCRRLQSPHARQAH